MDKARADTQAVEREHAALLAELAELKTAAAGHDATHKSLVRENETLKGKIAKLRECAP